MDNVPASVCQLEQASDPRAAGFNVLIVEDNPMQKMLMKELVKQLGHQSSFAANGLEAVSAVRSEYFDVILMDREMPLMDGLQATKIIREILRSTGQHSIIIGVTASAAPEECLRHGMDDYLRKPVSEPLLRAAIGRLVREKNGSPDQRRNAD